RSLRTRHHFTCPHDRLNSRPASHRSLIGSLNTSRRFERFRYGRAPPPPPRDTRAVLLRSLSPVPRRGRGRFLEDAEVPLANGRVRCPTDVNASQEESGYDSA